MFGCFQDIAAFHAANLGGSVTRLHDELNVAWILVRVRVEVDRYPMYADEVTVETWPQKPRGLYERDYRIRRASDGEVLVRAGSVWAIMNLATREVKRDQFLDYAGVEIKKDRALGKSFGRMKPQPDGGLAYEKIIRYSDLDYNSHVNNSKYVDIAMDAVPFTEHRGRAVRAFEIHYSNEAGPDSVLEIRKKTLDDGRLYVDGVRQGDGLDVFNAVIEFDG
jgi:acyl-ACP thioesterase